MHGIHGTYLNSPVPLIKTKPKKLHPRDYDAYMSALSISHLNNELGKTNVLSQYYALLINCFLFYILIN